MISEFNRYMDINNKIILFLVGEIERADQKGVINWGDFINYCINIGVDNPIHIVNVPISILTDLIIAARKKAKYTDELNKWNNNVK